MNTLESIPIYILISTTLFGIIGFLFKRQIEFDFNKHLESIKKEHSMELAIHQAEIENLKSKDNFKFLRLHEKRFKVLAQLYRLLKKVIPPLMDYVAPIKNTNEKSLIDYGDELRENFIKKHNAFVIFYRNNQIFLPPNLCVLLDEYIDATIEIYNVYFQNHLQLKSKLNFDPEKHKNAFEAYKKINENLKPITKEIESHFRYILEKI